MHSAPYPTYRGYQNQNGYVYKEHEYPEYAPQGGPTRTNGPPVQQQPQPVSNPFLPVTAQPTPAVSKAQKRNNRKKQRSAAQGAVIRPLLRAAPSRRWILVPAQPSGNELPQKRCLEYNSIAGASEAQHPQPGPEPLSVPQPQQPVLPLLIPKPQDTEPGLGKDMGMEDRRTPKLQINGSNKLYVEETLARMEQAAKES